MTGDARGGGNDRGCRRGCPSTPARLGTCRHPELRRAGDDAPLRREPGDAVAWATRSRHRGQRLLGSQPSGLRRGFPRRRARGPPGQPWVRGRNNAGVRAVAGMLPAEFVWIMNNDIILEERGAGRPVGRSDPLRSRRAAASPLIDDPRLEGNPRTRTQVRRVPGFVDMVVAYSSWLAKLPGLRHIYARQMYRDRLPYPAEAEIDSETVNGNCFMARMDFVEEIGYFNEGIFLYFEELILGWQMQERGRHGSLVTGVIVDHFQGSTSKHGLSGFQDLDVPRGSAEPGALRPSIPSCSDPRIWGLYAVRVTDYLVRYSEPTKPESGMTYFLTNAAGLSVVSTAAARHQEPQRGPFLVHVRLLGGLGDLPGRGSAGSGGTDPPGGGTRHRALRRVGDLPRGPALRRAASSP